LEDCCQKKKISKFIGRGDLDGKKVSRENHNYTTTQIGSQHLTKRSHITATQKNHHPLKNYDPTTNHCSKILFVKFLK